MKYLKTFENKYTQKDLDKLLIKFSSKISALQKMRELIDAGANVNYCDINNGTPLMNSAKMFFYNGVKLLIDNGADVNIVNRFNESALIIMAKYPNYTFTKNRNSLNKIIDLFIDNNIDLNIRSIEVRGFSQNYKNYTALEYNDYIKIYIKEKYPEKYNDYLLKKDLEKYNL